ncbi:unnamed protein product [Prorocentrum cordatum]|uniref:Uncharacterized protein n=1 Tax=Prorocentrum cordatum TaxID=2364126 RepID=A0ABN9VCP0_9DINO|nr:unnamed protein product [Polarella glacialis]
MPRVKAAAELGRGEETTAQARSKNLRGPLKVHVYAMVCAPYSGTRGGDQRAARTPRRLPTRGQPGEVIAARRDPEAPSLYSVLEASQRGGARADGARGLAASLVTRRCLGDVGIEGCGGTAGARRGNIGSGLSHCSDR